MRIIDMIGFVFAVIVLLIVSILFYAGIDWLGEKFPYVLGALGILLLTGILWIFAYIAAGLTINAYDKSIERYDRNHPHEVGYRGQPQSEVFIVMAFRDE